MLTSERILYARNNTPSCDFKEKRLVLLNMAVQALKNAGRRNAVVKQLLIQAKQELADVLINSGNTFKSEGQYEKAKDSIQHALHILHNVPRRMTKSSKKGLYRDLENLQRLVESQQAVVEIREFFGREIQKIKKINFKHAVPEEQLNENNRGQIDSSL